MPHHRIKGRDRTHDRFDCRYFMLAIRAGTPYTTTEKKPRDCSKCDECQRLMRLERKKAKK